METSSLLSNRLHNASSTDLNTGFSTLYARTGNTAIFWQNSADLTRTSCFFFWPLPILPYLSFHFPLLFPSLLSCSHHKETVPLYLHLFSLQSQVYLTCHSASQAAWFIQFFYLPISSTHGSLNFPDNEGGRSLWIIGPLIKATELWGTMPQFQTQGIYYDCQIFYFVRQNAKFWREILILIIKPKHISLPTMWTCDPIQNA